MNIADFLQQERVQFQVIPHYDTFDAQHLAQSMHVSGRLVAKTVLLRVEGGRTFVVAVLPANRAVDFELAAEVLGGGHVTLASEQEVVQHCPDCETGVLPPFGRQYGMKTMVDESLLEDEEIIFEGNTHHEAIRMKLADYRHIEEPLVGSFAQAS
ncbi:MAG: aminoacyl-tRNA deacylase [Pirellulaceae bacterium]